MPEGVVHGSSSSCPRLRPSCPVGSARVHSDPLSPRSRSAPLAPCAVPLPAPVRPPRLSLHPDGPDSRCLSLPSHRTSRPLAPPQAAGNEGDPDSDSLLLDPRASSHLPPALLKAAARVYAHPAVIQVSRGAGPVCWLSAPCEGGSEEQGRVDSEGEIGGGAARGEGGA